MAEVLAACIPAPGRAIEVRALPEPELEPGAALLRVELSEVCGTDVHLRDGRLEGVPYPLVPGHVTSGTIEKLRGRVADVDGRPFEEGERVTFLDVHRTCHACWYCLVAKATTRCPERRVYGITYGARDGLCGGWAQKVHLKPGTRLLRLGEASSEAFMAGGCGLPTAIHALERAEPRLGESVLVLGSGPVGLSLVALARLSGAARVLCIGAPRARLECALRMGAAEVADIGELDEDARLSWVRERTGGRGADLVLEATGSPRAVVQAMRQARDAGRVVIVGQYTDHGDVAFNPHLDLNRKHLELRGSWGSDYSHFHRAVELVGDPERARPWSELPLRRFGLAQLDEALAEVEAGRVVKALVDPSL